MMAMIRTMVMAIDDSNDDDDNDADDDNNGDGDNNDDGDDYNYGYEDANDGD